MKQRILRNDVLAIETRKNLFVLAQSVGNGTLAFFNHFNKNIQEFNTVELNYKNILCYITPVKTFFQKSNIIKIDLKPIDNLREKFIQKEHLSFELMCERKKYKIYTGTDDELEIENIFDGNLRLVNWKLETIKELDKKIDKDIIKNYQLDTMGMYGELNEKLYLSYRYGKYVEPIKELIIGEKIPIEYKIYFLIYSQKITEEVWKKLSI